MEAVGIGIGELTAIGACEGDRGGDRVSFPVVSVKRSGEATIMES